MENISRQRWIEVSIIYHYNCSPFRHFSLYSCLHGFSSHGFETLCFKHKVRDEQNAKCKIQAIAAWTLEITFMFQMVFIHKNKIFNNDDVERKNITITSYCLCQKSSVASKNIWALCLTISNGWKMDQWNEIRSQEMKSNLIGIASFYRWMASNFLPFWTESFIFFHPLLLPYFHSECTYLFSNPYIYDKINA